MNRPRNRSATLSDRKESGSFPWLRSLAGPGRRSVDFVTLVVAVAAGGLALLGSGPKATDHGPSRIALSAFAEDTLIVGRVLQNSTECAGDRGRLMRIEFADTSVVALYGVRLHELGFRRRGLRCYRVPGAVAGIAERIAAGEVVFVELKNCLPGEGDVFTIQKVVRGPGRSNGLAMADCRRLIRARQRLRAIPTQGKRSPAGPQRTERRF